MERLEKNLEKTSIKKESEKDLNAYRGLQLIDEKIYASGTSIKYWM